jgi:hypothetical protein
MQQPHIRLTRNRKLQILLCNRVPILVHHHHSKEITNGGEEEAVEVVFDLGTYFGGEGVESDLSDADEEDTECNVAEGPSVFEGVEDEGDLEDYVDDEEDAVEDVEDDEEGCCGGGGEGGPALEGAEGDGAGDQECSERRETEQLPQSQYCIGRGSGVEVPRGREGCRLRRIGILQSR